jgi:hypothetical protein
MLMQPASTPLLFMALSEIGEVREVYRVTFLRRGTIACEQVSRQIAANVLRRDDPAVS